MLDPDTLVTGSQTRSRWARHDMPEQTFSQDQGSSVHEVSTVTKAMVADAFIRLAFDDCATVARSHAIGGVLTNLDRAGLYRRVARANGTTPDRVATLCANR